MRRPFCDECVEFCTDIICEEALLWEVMSLLFKAAEQGKADYDDSRFDVYGKCNVGQQRFDG